MAKYLNLTGLQTLVTNIDNKYASKAVVPEAYQPKITAGTGLAFAGNTLNVTLDTTLYQVVESLPESEQNPNKIYLMLGEAGEQNTYTEYLWVNNKWEKLGEYKAAIDLTPYLKKTEAAELYASITHQHPFTDITGKATSEQLPVATASTIGAVKGGSTAGKVYGIAIDGEGAMTVNVPWTDTTYTAAVASGADGLMTGADKAKLDAIEEGANKYVLPTATDAVKGGVKASSAAAPDGETSVKINTFMTGDQIFAALPVASTETVGGIKIGSGLAIAGGVVSVDAGSVEAGSVQWANVKGKPGVFATNIANINDLEAGWDTILAAAPTAFVDAISDEEINGLFD